MIPDLNFWGRFVGVLAAELALVAAVTSLIAVWIRAPQIRRALWQAALIALAVAGVSEFAGVRGLVTKWWLATNSTPPRRLAATVRPSVELEPASEPVFPVTERPISRVAVPASSPTPAPVWWPGYLWLLGAGLLGFRALALRGWLAQKCRRAEPGDPVTQDMVGRLKATLGLARVELRVWPQLRGPVAFGTWRPTIAVPADFSSRFTSAQQEAMLAHELAHLAGRDPLWLAVADAVGALFWWHPGVWWTRHQLRIAGEEAADEASTLVPNGVTALAESLVVFGRELATPGFPRSLGVAGTGFRSELGRRVAALLRSRGEWRPLARGQRWILRLAAVVAVVFLGVLPGPGRGGPSVAGLLSPAYARSAVGPRVAEPGRNVPLRWSPNHVAPLAVSLTNVFRSVAALGYTLEKSPLEAASWEHSDGSSSSYTNELSKWAVTLTNLSGRWSFFVLPEATNRLRKTQPPTATEVLPTRTFHVDPARLLPAVRGADGLSSRGDTLFNIRQFLALCGGRLPDLLFSHVPFSTVTPSSEPDVAFNDKAGVLTVRAPFDDLEVIQQVLSALEPVVTLECRFAEITAGSADDIGLDWLFGVSQTNNPAPEIAPLNTQGGRVETLRNDGQFATLSAAQFVALRRRLEGRNGTDILSGLAVTARSGQPAQISVADMRTIVTGVDALSPSPTNQAEIRYHTEQMPFGPTLDVTPHAEADGWRLTLVARVTEFLGYDAPGRGDEVKVQSPGAKPVLGTKPLPRLRVREMRAEALARPGETIALRGAMADAVTVSQRGFFRRAQTNIVHKRLYAFVTPVTLGSAASEATVGAKRTLIILVRAQSPYPYQIGDHALKDTELPGVLKEAAARKSNLIVLIRADPDAPFEKVRALTDLARQEGIANLVLQSESAKARP